MFEPLSNHDLARLHAKFVVPIVVDQMLREEEPLDDVAEYAMNEILTELCPDTALLCIAMCAAHVARETEHLPISKALTLASQQIIDEYGPLWIAHEQNPHMLDQAAVAEMLAYIPEDFETLRDLLDSIMGELGEDHSIAAILCDILSLQADYHRDIAEVELANIHLLPQKREEETMGGIPAACEKSNVIPFPADKRHQRQRIRN